MNRLLAIAFLVLLAVSAAIIIGSSAQLPARVGSHFAANSLANGWQTREAYVRWILLFAVGAPCVVVAAIGWLPRHFPGLCNLPNRDYWLAPQRRDATLAALASFGFAIGALTALFALGVHITVVDANSPAPPMLAAKWLVPALLAVFITPLVVLAFVYHRRFRRRG